MARKKFVLPCVIHVETVTFRVTGGVRHLGLMTSVVHHYYMETLSDTMHVETVAFRVSRRVRHFDLMASVVHYHFMDPCQTLCTCKP